MTPREAAQSTKPDLNLEWGPVAIMFDKPEVLTAIRYLEAAWLVDLSTGKDVLEIGSGHGYSAIVMALNGAKSVVSVDDHCGTTQLGDTFSIMRNNLENFGVEHKVEMIKGDSTIALTHLIRQKRKFDFIFVDGNETYKQICIDIALSMVLLKEGGTLAVHDYNHSSYPDKKSAVDLFFPEGPDQLKTSLFIKQL